MASSYHQKFSVLSVIIVVCVCEIHAQVTGNLRPYLYRDGSNYGVGGYYVSDVSRISGNPFNLRRLFPESFAPAENVAAPEPKPEIPKSVLIELSQVDSVDDFLTRFRVAGAPPPKNKTLLFKPSSGGTGETSITDMFSLSGAVPRRDNYYENEVAVSPGCKVRPYIVSVPQPEDPSELHWPTCVEVNRCDGCCTDDVLECTSTHKQTVFKKVIKVKYTAGQYFEYKGEVHVPLEYHVQDSCTCACKKKPDDCSSNQIYKDCQCLCPNGNLAGQCAPPKKWNEHLCDCVCPYGQEVCSSFQFFDPNTCLCVSRGK